MIVVIKKLISGIRKFCVFLFWPQKTDKNRYDDRNQQKTNMLNNDHLFFDDVKK